MMHRNRPADRDERRQFLKSCATATSAFVLGSMTGCGDTKTAEKAGGENAKTLPKIRKKGLVLATGKFGYQGQDVSSLTRIDLDQPDVIPQIMPIPFFPHGVVIDPRNPERLVLFEKRGKGACQVDLASGRILRPIETVESREFYGHGAYSNDAQRLFATETEVDGDYKGVVAVRDAASHELIGNFPTYGIEPHDCRLMADGKTLAITNGGAEPGEELPPSVTYVDVDSEKLVERIEIPVAHLNAGHLAFTPRGDLAVVSAPRKGMMFERNVNDLGGVTLRPKNGAVFSVQEPAGILKRMLRESLSVAIHEPTSTVGVTNPEGDIVTFWHLLEGRFLGSLDVQGPRGIALTLDGQEFLVTHGKGRSLSFVSPETLEIVDTRELTDPVLTGSHIVVHNLPMG